MPRAPSSPQWLTLAVLLPLVVLGVLAWMGVKAQVRAAWSSAKEEARVAGRNAQAVLERELSEALQTAALFPDPPVPGEAFEADAVLDGGDPAKLRSLRDDPEAGISPAGLPRRVLAGFRLLESGGNAEDLAMLVKLATRDAPSLLTPLVLRNAGDVAKQEAELWSAGDRAREACRRRPQTSEAGVWMDGDITWMAKEGNTLRFIEGGGLKRALLVAGESLPKWASIRLVAVGKVFPSDQGSGEIMETLPVKFGEGLRLELIAARPDLIEASARRQGRWTLGLLGCAVLVSGSALGMMHHSIRRERRLSEMKSQFVASVSHELRAPVASIRLMADALEEEKVDPETAREFHRLIAREGARLSTLVANVLDHARIEQGRKVWNMEPCDLAALTNETLRVMEPLANEKEIILEADLSAAEAVVDAGAIQQALVNLLDNAIKFSPRGTTVRTSLTMNGNHWCLAVRDQGPGISKEEHHRIFERFYRPGDELRRESQGTGIGLSLVKSIVEAHGGQVLLESSLGKGSVFTLTGPISPPP